MDSDQSRAAAGLAARLAGFVAGSRPRAVTIVVLVLVAAALALGVGRRIKLNTKLEALLPSTAPSVVALDELRARQGSTDRLTLAIRSDDYEAGARLIDAVADRMATWPETVRVIARRDHTVVRDHALYYLDLAQLEELRDRLARERQIAVARKLRTGVGDGDVDLRAVVVGDDWDDDPPEQADQPERNDAEREELGVRALLDQQRERLAADGRIARQDLDLLWPRENEAGELVWEDEVLRRLESPDKTTQAVQIELDQPPTDFKFTREINQRIRDMMDELDPTSYAPDMLWKTAGAYSAAREADAIVRDLRTATWVSGVLVAGVLVFGFRRARSLVLVLVPLAVSVSLTLALVQMSYGELNILTAFLFAVLLGLGVDFAVHLYAQRENGGTTTWRDVFADHLRPLTSSMLTTLGSFAVLTLGDFRGFREFGVIAGIGLVVCFVVSVVMVPALDVAIGGRRTADSPAPVTEAHGRPTSSFVRPAAIVLLAVVGGLGAPRVDFEDDLRNIRAPKTEAQGIASSRALGSRRGLRISMLADSPAQLEEAIGRLDADRETIIDDRVDESWIKRLVSVSAVLPADQDRKREVLEEIARHANGFLAELPDLRTDDPAGKFATHLEALHTLASQAPLTANGLPAWIRDPFSEDDGSVDKIGLLYAQVDDWNADQVVELTNHFEEVVGDTGVRGATSSFVLGEAVMTLERDAGRLPLFALAAIWLFILADLRRLGPSLVVFGSLALGLAATFGLMGLVPIRINFYNLVVMPAVVGIGIDASIHLWHARRLGSVGTTAKAAIISALTTAGAFAGLIAVDHLGLRSIGILGVASTLCCVFAALVTLAVVQPSEPVLERNQRLDAQ